ncbi:MAG: hypothetical protein CL840_01560 [Crocinitomicaceae bacterium]|nr:hypothetical protein [Crocinitomicaceae bacterium]|tara:strand:+ start:8272 stop:9735 length:1464 start_codon:yes stop_codon:yes gene_type:complete
MNRFIIFTFVLSFLIFSCQESTSPENQSSRENSNNQSGINNSDTQSQNQPEQQDSSRASITANDWTESFANHSMTYQPVDYSSLKPKRQVFKISGTNDNIITTKNGVDFFVPAQCFINNKGAVVKGEVEMQITEYLDQFDLVANRLTTTSNGEPLESEGMFYIRAISEGEELSLKPYSELVMQLPREVDTNMRIYAGKRDRNNQLNWERDPYSTQPYPCMVTVGGKYGELTKDFFENNFRFSKKSMLNLLDSSMGYSVSFGKKGYVIGTHVCDNSFNEDRNVACSRFMELAEVLRDTFPDQLNRSIKTEFSFKLMQYDNYKAYREAKRQERLEFEAKLKHEEETREMQRTIGEALREDKAIETFYKKRRSFFIGNLGPINIDMKLAPEIPRGDVIIADEERWKDYHLLVKNRRALFLANYSVKGNYLFSNLPRNKNVTLISSYMKDGQIYFASTNFKTKPNTVISSSDLNFRQLASLEELKEVINSL